MTDKFLFIEDLKGINGEIAQTNAFEKLEAILDEEVECRMCDEKDGEIEQLQDDAIGYENRIKELAVQNKMLEEGFTVVK